MKEELIQAAIKGSVSANNFLSEQEDDMFHNSGSALIKSLVTRSILDWQLKAKPGAAEVHNVQTMVAEIGYWDVIST